MSRWTGICVVAGVVLSVACGGQAGLGGGGGGTGATGSTGGGAPKIAKLTIKIKKDPNSTDCIGRTIPKHLDFDKDDYDHLEWTIQDKDGCLGTTADVELVFGKAGNPTACTSLKTTSTKKRQIDCALGTYDTNKIYKYDVIKVGQTKIVEDPDIEIVEF